LDLILDTLLEADRFKVVATDLELEQEIQAIETQFPGPALPELSAAELGVDEMNTVGDPMIDELIEMNRHNQQLFKSAGSLIGQ